MAIREVNLVPADILERRHLRCHFFFWIGCLMILLALIWGFHFYRTGRAFAQSQDQMDTGAIERELLSKMNDIKLMKEKIAALDQKRKGIESLSAGPPYSWIIMNLTGRMNGATWLQTLSIDREKESGRTRVMMSGYSFGNEDLGEFLNRLNEEPLFDDVVLRYAREKNMQIPGRIQTNPVDVAEFQIDFAVSSGQRS